MLLKVLMGFKKKIYYFWLEWGLSFMAGLFITTLFFALRLKNLTSLPIFADEAIYIRWSQIMASEPTLRFLPLSDGKQPLFMWVLMFFIDKFSDPLFAGRLLSVFSGFATLLAIAFLSYYLFRSKKIALLSALIWTVSPFAFFFDRMALVDSMLAAFGMWTLFFAVLTFKTLRTDFAMLTGFALGFGLLTKSPAIFFVFFLPVTWLVSRWPKKKDVPKHFLKIFFLTIIAYVIASGMYNILRLGPNFYLISARNSDYVFPIDHLLKSPQDPLIPHLKDIILWVWTLGPFFLFVFSIFGVFSGIRKYLKEVIMILILIFVPLFVQAEYAKVFTARYIFFVIPLFVLIAALSFGLKSRISNIFLWPIFIFFVLYSLGIDYLLAVSPDKAPLPRGERSGYLEEWTAGTGIREVAEFIKRERDKNPGQQIVVGTEGYFGTLPNGLQIYFDKVPGVIIIGVGVIISDIEPSLISAKQAGNKVYLIVNSTRFRSEPGKLGLRLIRSYPKAVRPDGSYESLLFFELIDTHSLETDKANHVF